MTEDEMLKYLTKNIREDIHQLIESYITEMEAINYGLPPRNVLLTLGVIQSVTQELYLQGLGGKETAMLFYAIADRLVDRISDKEADKQLANFITKKKRKNNG
jgi:pyruvate-formate lyase